MAMIERRILGIAGHEKDAQLGRLLSC